MAYMVTIRKADRRYLAGEFRYHSYFDPTDDRKGLYERLEREYPFPRFRFEIRPWPDTTPRNGWRGTNAVL